MTEKIQAALAQAQQLHDELTALAADARAERDAYDLAYGPDYPDPEIDILNDQLNALDNAELKLAETVEQLRWVA